MPVAAAVHELLRVMCSWCTLVVWPAQQTLGKCMACDPAVCGAAQQTLRNNMLRHASRCVHVCYDCCAAAACAPVAATACVWTTCNVSGCSSGWHFASPKPCTGMAYGLNECTATDHACVLHMCTGM